MADHKAGTTAVHSIAPQVATSTKTGTGVDLFGYRGAVCDVHFGAWTDGTHTPKLQESDDNSTFTDVAASGLSGSFSAVSSSAGQNAVQSVGYTGSKRYIRPVVTVSGATSGALVASHITRAFPVNRPAGVTPI